MSITLTPAAIDKIKQQLKHRGYGVGIRLGVRKSGCSGMAYVLEFFDEIDDLDHLFTFDTVRVAIDPKSFVYLKGIDIDYCREGVNEGFKFRNPNADNECGCGESFYVE
ncbi:MAG: iron-sulfur cluster assembly protein IscA [Endozoicomonadaceae bacterium]|nr:iron-sulfur cluster assembly protein IscA [Endozoicomonadaceae bacterium]